MKIWVDAQLSPAIATWISSTFGVTALALRDIGLRDAEDPEIFEAAKAQGVIFIPHSALSTGTSGINDAATDSQKPWPEIYLNKQHLFSTAL
ncbi:DUF5615 family PIN-like protein [Leptodesmis sichuanensis]|uniref:DUF5615 family PIN-like protein n=1 Tax=Leptodesmis sichuanensis TaxID=2906798 RepID=UPI001F1770A8|nr:DUF5615 family PIN-like protein [Leptodesmis sichuanensis]UIE39462.1 DUF5615 family PIN-like protein [Leptodesmis sichuanensis A121]